MLQGSLILFERSDNQHKFHATTKVLVKVVSNVLLKCSRKKMRNNHE